jgi:hypothetical protein
LARFLDQRGLTVFVVLVGQGEPCAGYPEEGYFALAIVSLSGNLHARSGMHFVHFLLAIAWHWGIPNTMHMGWEGARENKRLDPVGYHRAEASSQYAVHPPAPDDDAGDKLLIG